MAFDSKINKVYASVERRKPCIERKKGKKSEKKHSTVFDSLSQYNTAV